MTRTLWVCGVLFVGCAGAKADLGPIRAVDAPEVRAETISRELRLRGYTCSVNVTRAVCEKDDTYKFVIDSSSDPSTMILSASFTSRVPCSDGEMGKKLMEANRVSDLQLACADEEDGSWTVSFSTMSLVPRGGFAVDELDSYLHHLSGRIQYDLGHYGLMDWMK